MPQKGKRHHMNTYMQKLGLAYDDVNEKYGALKRAAQEYIDATRVVAAIEYAEHGPDAPAESDAQKRFLAHALCLLTGA